MTMTYNLNMNIL